MVLRDFKLIFKYLSAKEPNTYYFGEIFQYDAYMNLNIFSISAVKLFSVRP